MTARALALVALLAAPAAAQDGETLTLSLGGEVPVSGRLGPAWAPGPGAMGAAAVPLHGGVLRASADWIPHDAQTSEVPDFEALTLALGWGPEARLGPVRLRAGAEVGMGRYDFEDDDVFGANVSEESELLAGLYAGVRVPVAGPVEAWAEGGVRRVFFSTPADVGAVRAGVAVRLRSPRWLRDALR